MKIAVFWIVWVPYAILQLMLAILIFLFLLMGMFLDDVSEDLFAVFSRLGRWIFGIEEWDEMIDNTED